jgi:hypothetical protein
MEEFPQFFGMMDSLFAEEWPALEAEDFVFVIPLRCNILGLN